MLPRLGSIPLRELTLDAIPRFRLELESDGVGPASIRKSLVVLHGVLQRACEWGRLASNPAAIAREPVPRRRGAGASVSARTPRNAARRGCQLDRRDRWDQDRSHACSGRWQTSASGDCTAGGLAAEAAGVEWPRTYNLRHSFVSCSSPRAATWSTSRARQATLRRWRSTPTRTRSRNSDPAEHVNASGRIRKPRELRFRP